MAEIPSSLPDHAREAFPPALKLRHYPGFALLERSAKAVRLTEAGHVFLAESKAMPARSDEAVQAARS